MSPATVSARQSAAAADASKRPVAHGAGCRERLATHLDRLPEIALVEPVHSELDLEHRRFGGRPVG